MANSSQLEHQCLLTCQNLSWSVADKHILNDICFNVAVGDFVGIIGPNGAGKSSLLRCLYRYIRPTQGQVQYLGQDIWHWPAKEYAQNVAVVLQHTPQQFQLTLTDVVNQGVIPHSSLFAGFCSDHSDDVNNALAQVGLIDKRHMSFELLSGGEKQRAMIAKAIVQKTQLLIMDEPTSHLDVKYQIQIMELAKSLGITIIASFHDLNLASAICDQLIVLKQGELVEQGRPEQVITEPMLSNVFDVCAEVKPHPQHQRPHVTYFYGYQPTGDRFQGKTS